MVGAGAFLLHRHLQGAGEILRSEPPLEGPVPDGCSAFTILVASKLAAESLERRCLLPGIVAAAQAVPCAIAECGMRSAESQTDAAPATNDPSAAAVPQSAIRSPQSPEGAGPVPTATSTILVDTRRVDRVMNMVGELVIARSMFHQAFTELQTRFPKAEFLDGFREAHRLMDRSLADLQKGVMKIRMVPIDRVFRRLPRIVRDLSDASGGAKTVRLELEGRATELDKGIVDALGEPLVHLIRNAVDHGIEPAAGRRAAGKPPVGTVRVAARAEGNQIVIEIADDGGGIDPAAIRRTAVARGLLQAQAADALTDAQILDLIFLPRFSTAAHVTDTSGRGIGMDAVRVSVEALKGQIQVDSRVGRGTTFTLRVPLTLAIIRAMLFRVAGRLFALPLSTIAEIARVEPAAVRTVDGHEVLHLRDRVISLVRLQEALRIAGCGLRDGDGDAPGEPEPQVSLPQSAFRNPTHTADAQRRLYVLIVALAEQRIGLVVDRLQGEGELVIKALDAEWVSGAPIAGGAILGDGRVVLILDPGALIQRTLTRGRVAWAGREAVPEGEGVGVRP
jgi:two-component system chemotaxis sensor kinase CheA